MKKGLIICSGGMSSTIIAKELTKVSGGKIEVTATGVMGDFSKHIIGKDIILISPQISFQAPQIKQAAEKLGIKTLLIKPNLYISTRAQALFDEIKEVISL